MKKIIIMMLSVLLFTGCTVVRIDTDKIDTIINVVLSKDNSLYNTIGQGYKYYKPRGVTMIDSNNYNDKLYANGYNYYLYVDITSFYYKKELNYQVNKEAYYSKFIDINNKQGYLEINKHTDDYYLVEFMYNYAKMEALVEEKDVNDVVLDATYILSTIKYNSSVIKITLDEEYLISKEEIYDIFTPKKEEIIDNTIKID